jgi:hypothetical protein
VRKRYIKSIKSRIYDYVVANYPMIEKDKFVLGEISYTYKCHLNSVQKVKESKASKVIACIAIEKGKWENIIVHFINQLEDGRYQDNTWGWLYKGWDYYMVKEINPNEFDNIDNMLGYIQSTLLKGNSNTIMRKLFRVGTIV